MRTKAWNFTNWKHQQNKDVIKLGLRPRRSFNSCSICASESRGWRSSRPFSNKSARRSPRVVLGFHLDGCGLPFLFIVVLRRLSWLGCPDRTVSVAKRPGKLASHKVAGKPPTVHPSCRDGGNPG